MQIKKELELHDIQLAKGAQTRARAKWIEEGEKNTKYFLRLEKARGTTNTISSIRIENKYTDDPIKILAEIRTFYEELYKGGIQKDTDRNIKTHFLANDPFPTLSEEERAECEKDITIEELPHALTLLNKDAAPGCDGLPPTFYSQFWGILQGPFFECVKQSVEEGELPLTLRKGIITLIHKGKGLDGNDMVNYRPITLTNTDYKILTKGWQSGYKKSSVQLSAKTKLALLKEETSHPIFDYSTT